MEAFDIKYLQKRELTAWISVFVSAGQFLSVAPWTGLRQSCVLVFSLLPLPSLQDMLEEIRKICWRNKKNKEIFKQLLAYFGT